MSDLIEQHIAVLRAEGASPDTRRDRRRVLLRLHDDLPHGILYACTEQLQAWLGYERWSRWTRYTYAGHVFAFYRWLHAAGIREDDPTATMRRPKVPACVPRPATEDEIRLALAAPEPIRTAAHLAYYQGMRRAEIARCCREHITEDLTVIPVAKGGDVQTIPTHPAVWEIVRDIPPSDDPWQPQRLILEDGEPVTPQRLGRLVHYWSRSVGLRGWGLHRLRHAFGTEIQRASGDIRVTQECLRHRSIRSTQIYTAVTDEQRRAAVARLPWIGHRPDAGRPVPPAA